jgi:serine/threonine protein kinase
MPDTNSSATMDTNTPEVRLNRLEAAWRAGASPPDWRQHVPVDAGPCSPQLVFDLLQLDIEYRIKAGLPALLSERYFEHPRLQHEDARLSAGQQVELIHWEYQLRRQQGEPAQRAEYEAAFPQHAEAVREMKLQSRCPRCRKVIDLEETSQTLCCPNCGSLPLEVTADPPVELDLRQYELIVQLGKGAMGEIYRASDPALGRDLAIKVMKADLHGQPGIERRFLREARVTGSLQHPGIVPVHNLGRLADGRLHYTMRLVRGRTFADILKEEAGKAERWPYLMTIFEKICQAVAYAHSKRVIHRDLKPSNVMVGRFGEVQVMDWGLAKLLTAESVAECEEPRISVEGTLIHTESADAPKDLTRAGTVIGTLPYMSPEQAQSDWELVDERTDVFALGSILCEILTGEPAYRGEHVREVLRCAKRGDLADALRRLENCGADAMLLDLCLECLSREREGRPRDAGVVAERTNRYQEAVQDRLRRAELERVEAESRAREEQARVEAEEARTRDALARLAAERRTRRRLLALSGAVLVTIATAFVLVRVWAEQAYEAKNLAEKNEKLAIAERELAELEKTAREQALEKAQKSQREADREARKAQGVAKLLEGIFEASDPVGLTSQSVIVPHAAGEKLSAQELLKRGAEQCQRDLRDQPDVQAVALAAIGNAYVNLGEYDLGKPLLEKALQLVEQAKGNPQEIATIQHSLGSLYHAKGHYDTAEKLYQSALQLREKTKPINELFIADTLFNLGWLLTEKEDYTKAVECYKRCLALRTKNLGNKHRLVALCQVGLAAVYLDKNEDYFRALSLISESIQTFKVLEGGHPSLEKAMGLFQTGIMHLHSSARVSFLNVVAPGTREEGVKRLKECLQLVKESPLGKDNIYVAFVSGTLALEFSRTNEDERAKPYFEECLRIVEDRVGLWHPKLDKLAPAYAALLIRQQKKQEADHLCRRILKAREDRFGKDHPQAANALVSYALARDVSDPEREKMLVRARGIYERAQQLGITSLRMYEWCLNHLGVCAFNLRHNPVDAEKIFRTTWNKFGDCACIDRIDLAVLQNNLAFSLIEQTKYAEAEEWLKKAQRVCQEQGERAQVAWKNNLNIFVHMYMRQRQPEKVAALCLERRERWPNDPDQVFLAGRNYLECAALVGHGPEALTEAEQKQRQEYVNQGIATCQTAVKLYRKTAPDKPQTIGAIANMGIACRDADRIKDAIALLEEARQLWLKLPGEAAAPFAWIPGALAETLDRDGQFAKAEFLYRDLVEQARRQFGTEDARTAGQMAGLALNLLHQHKYTEAEPLIRDCLKVSEARQPDDWATFNARSLLGAALLGQKKYSDAEPLLILGYEGMKERQEKIPPLLRKHRLSEAAEWTLHLYERTDQKDKADDWRKRMIETKTVQKVPKS